VLGLNISASFNSAKVIYIMIPVLIIPQLLFSGIIVKFDKLHPWFASERSVPWIGNIMASRWAYEGLAVTQFMENRYEKQFYPLDRRMKTANWKKDLWIRELENASGNVRRALADLSTSAGMEHDLSLLRGELERETKALNGFEVPLMDRLEPGRVDLKVLDQVDAALRTLTQHYRTAYKTAEAEKEQLITQLTGTSVNRSEYFAQLDAYRNESLAEVVTNKNDVNVIVEYRGELVQKSDPVYLEPRYSGFFGAQFYAPAKYLGGIRIPTLWANALVLWGMALLLGIALYAEVFLRMLNALPRSRRQA
jgi:hypothetical protein